MSTRRQIYIIILLIAVRGVSAFECPKNENKICSCKMHDWDRLILYCQINDSYINIESTLTKLTITCHNAKWSDFQLYNFIKLPTHNVYFYMCDLPNSSLKTITDMLGATVYINKLAFYSHKNLTPNIKRMHLKGFEYLEYLDISDNNISVLDSDLLADLPNLKILEARRNNIHVTSFLDYVDPKLQDLDLDDNKLGSIKPGTFDRLRELDSLYIENNGISELQSGTFDKLVKLEILDLNSNNLVSLPEDIFWQLKGLKDLYLMNNSFTSLPNYLLKNNKNLEHIYLASNRGKLNTLSSGFFSNLTNLTHLYLSNNRFTSLPEDLLWGCISLDILDLSENNLDYLPELIFRDLEELTDLNLAFNIFQELSNHIFSNLTNLKFLDLSKNRISSINVETFTNLYKLMQLNMAENYLTVIPGKSFMFLKNLRVANFSYNYLTLYPTTEHNTDLVDSPFVFCQSLQELYLSNNRITEIFYDWINELMHLSKLDLKNNYIYSLSPEDLIFISKNIVVDLTYNKIENIFFNNAEEFFSNGWSNKVKVLIQNNPLHCNCELYDYLHYIEGGMHPNVKKYINIDPENVTCFTPLKLRNVSVTDLQSLSFKCGTTKIDSMCPDKCSCHKKLNVQEYTIDCYRQNLTTVPSVQSVPHKLWTIILDLAYNQLTQTENLSKLGYGLVHHLILSHNNISKVSLDGLPKTLMILELHSNNITVIPSDVLSFLKHTKYLHSITLHDNPFICNCSTIDFFDFIHTSDKHKIHNLDKIACENKKKFIINMTKENFCPSEMGWFEKNVVWFILAFSVLFVICMFYWKNPYRIIKTFGFRPLLEENAIEEDNVIFSIPLTEEKQYDVFISYSQTDQDFVMNELVPKLENGASPLKLFIPHRDLVDEEWTATTITRSIEMSKRMMVVLSSSFLQDIWEKEELRDAHYQTSGNDQSDVILILYGDIDPTDEHLDAELKVYINRNTYIKWEDLLFWGKLGQSLMRNFEDESNANEFEESEV